MAESKVLNRNLVNGVPSSKENKDPRVLPRIARYGSRALTDSVRPKHRLMPKRKGSVLDRQLLCKLYHCLESLHSSKTPPTLFGACLSAKYGISPKP